MRVMVALALAGGVGMSCPVHGEEEGKATMAAPLRVSLADFDGRVDAWVRVQVEFPVIALQDASGARASVVYKPERRVEGVQGGIANNTSHLIGGQFGFFNSVRNARGIQVGVVNYAHSLNGVQIGFLNFNRGRIRSGVMFGWRW